MFPHFHPSHVSNTVYLQTTYNTYFSFINSVYYARSLVGWYFKWVRETNELKFRALIKMKKKIISKVQETETFNDAKSILEKFDPNALKEMSRSFTNLSNIGNEYMSPNFGAQNRRSFRTAPQPQPTPRLQIMPNPSAVPPNRPLFTLPSTQQQFNNTPLRPVQKTVKPILPQNRSIVEKAVDYMFGDGPSNRFALICSRCNCHNGMALPEEFEYINYICAYCSFFNPARKVKPVATAMDYSTKAIEGPRVEEADDSKGPQITEISSEINSPVRNCQLYKYFFNCFYFLN